MKYGNWIPMSKAFVKDLPRNRPYTELEATFSMQVDYDQNNPVTITGYSELWQWSKGKVMRFIKRMNCKIIYPERTTKKQNQRGLIVIQITDRSRTENGLITDRSRVTTKDPNPNLKDICPFEAVREAYNSTLGDVLPTCREMTGPRKKALQARWNEKHKTSDGELQSNRLEYWQRYFEYVKATNFLTGGSRDGWKPNFDWLTKKANFIKVIENTYK
jgi:hypothetical protein